MSDSPSSEADATSASSSTADTATDQPPQYRIGERLLTALRHLYVWRRTPQSVDQDDQTAPTATDEPQSPGKKPPAVSVEDEQTNTTGGSSACHDDVTLSPYLSADGGVRYRSDHAEARDGDIAMQPPLTELTATDDDATTTSTALDAGESE